MPTNPYRQGSKDWERWNIGLEDGSRGEVRRGKSAAYNEGWDAGISVFRVTGQQLAYRPTGIVAR